MITPAGRPQGIGPTIHGGFARRFVYSWPIARIGLLRLRMTPKGATLIGAAEMDGAVHDGEGLGQAGQAGRT